MWIVEIESQSCRFSFVVDVVNIIMLVFLFCVHMCACVRGCADTCAWVFTSALVCVYVWRPVFPSPSPLLTEAAFPVNQFYMIYQFVPEISLSWPPSSAGIISRLPCSHNSYIG